MAVVAVGTTYNEADIIEATCRHLLAEGVERILIADASSDETPEILAGIDGVTVTRDDEPCHRQPYWIDRLAAEAEAEWIVPFDADEFWYSEHGPLADVLDAVPGDVGKCYARMFKHRDWEHRHLHPTSLPKVAYRWTPAATVENGNHDVHGVIGRGEWGVVDIREFQYRGFDHYCRKIIERNATIDPSLPQDHGWHHKRLAGLSRGELEAEWAAIQAIETVFDPCPSSFPVSTVLT